MCEYFTFGNAGLSLQVNFKINFRRLVEKEKEKGKARFENITETPEFFVSDNLIVFYSTRKYFSFTIPFNHSIFFYSLKT